MTYLKHAIFCFTLTAAAPALSASEAEIYRLLNPTMEELQAELVFGHVHVYRGLSDELIEQALDEQFYRIEYMMFLDQDERDCK